MIRRLMLLPIIPALINCTSNSLSKGVYVETENIYDTLDGKKILISQIQRTFRSSDKKLVSELTKIDNYTDDYKLFLVTGLRKKDGLSSYLLDSIFYDEKGNDTLKKHYVRIKKNWVQKNHSKKIYRPDNQIMHFKTERVNDEKGFKKEVFYEYNGQGKLVEETEYECSDTHLCDSLLKKQYFYSLNGEKDSTRIFWWSGKKWVYRRTFINQKMAGDNCIKNSNFTAIHQNISLSIIETIATPHLL